MIPKELKYTKDHEWVRIEGNVAYIGVTDFAQDALGDIVYVDIDSLNEQLDKGEVFGTIEAVKTVSDLFLPLSGNIIEFNEDVESNPESINEDAYENWIIKVEFSDASEVDKLLTSEEYDSLINN